MVRKAEVEDRLYLLKYDAVDEAEGFLLEHAVFSPPRTWPPLAPETQDAYATLTRTKSDRLASSRRRVDWAAEAAAHPEDESAAALDLAVGSSSSWGKSKDAAASDDEDSERCVICLMGLKDRTAVGVCGHEFCFECIGVWANQSRRCPLCSADMTLFLLHDLDRAVPTKFYLPPLPSRSFAPVTLPGPSIRERRISDSFRHRPEEQAEKDDLDEQVDRRRQIYQHELYVKHIASNATTKYRPNPTPRQIAEDPALIQRATAFLRRELRVWSTVDVEFLVLHILSLLKAVDIRSEPAVRLLAEFLDPPHGPEFPHATEHFAHELYSFLRSPYKELARWDAAAQYDPLPDERGRSASPVQVDGRCAGSPHRSRSPSRSRSRSSPRSPLSSRSSAQRSLSPLPPRDPTRRDTFIPSPPRNARKWNEPDTWLDPDYEAWLAEKREREDQRRGRKRARRDPPAARGDESLSSGLRRQSEGVMRAWGPELQLPSPPPTEGLVANLETEEDIMAELPASSISILGAAKDMAPPPMLPTPPKKLSLEERLALAKAEAASRQAGLAVPSPTAPPMPPPTLTHSISEPAAGRAGLKEIVRARLRLRLKLESERGILSYNTNETRAQELRRRLIEARERRQAAETDATLKRLDRLERAKEIRRRLMVAKMMAAETEGERKARELKEKLVAERRRKMLKEMLLARKRASVAEQTPATPVTPTTSTSIVA